MTTVRTFPRLILPPWHCTACLVWWRGDAVCWCCDSDEHSLPRIGPLTVTGLGEVAA